MKNILAIVFDVTQGLNNGGIVREFDGKFGLKHWNFKEMFYYWTYATLCDGDNEDQSNPYWATHQMVQQFNAHYKNKFGHGWKVTFDEQIL